MPNTIKLELLGADLFRAAAKAIPGVLRQELAKAVHETVQMVRQSAIARAPRDRGDLKANIVLIGKSTALTQRVGVRDIDIAARGGKNTFHRNPGVYGAIAVEHGTKYMRAQAFLLPALTAAQPWYLAALERRRATIEGALAAFNRPSAG
jgi:HK97 gp10 family phage protein